MCSRPSLFEHESRSRSASFADLLIMNSVTGMTAVFRRDVALAAQPFPLSGCRYILHDHWIALVASLLGDIRFIDEPLVDYTQHAAQRDGRASAGREACFARAPRQIVAPIFANASDSLPGGAARSTSCGEASRRTRSRAPVSPPAASARSSIATLRGAAGLRLSLAAQIARGMAAGRPDVADMAREDRCPVLPEENQQAMLAG